MNRQERDSGDRLGVAVALALGVLVGLVAAFPALPSLSLSVGGTEVGPVGTALLIGALGIILVPLGVLVLYQLFVYFE